MTGIAPTAFSAEHSQLLGECLPLELAIASSGLAERRSLIPEPKHIGPDHLAHIVRRHLLRQQHAPVVDQFDTSLNPDVEALLAQLRQHEQTILELERVPDMSAFDAVEHRTHEALHDVWQERIAMDAAAGGEDAAAFEREGRTPAEWLQLRNALETAVGDTLAPLCDSAPTRQLAESDVRQTLEVSRGFLVRLAALVVEQIAAVDERRERLGALPRSAHTPTSDRA